MVKSLFNLFRILLFTCLHQVLVLAGEIFTVEQVSLSSACGLGLPHSMWDLNPQTRIGSLYPPMEVRLLTTGQTKEVPSG